MFSKKIVLWGLALACVIIGAVVVYSYSGHNPPPKPPGTTSDSSVNSVTGRTVDHPKRTTTPGEHDHCFGREDANDTSEDAHGNHRDVVLTVSLPGMTTGSVDAVLINMDPSIIYEDPDPTNGVKDLVGGPQPINNGTAEITFSDATNIPVGGTQRNGGGGGEGRSDRTHLGSGPYVASITATPTSLDGKGVLQTAKPIKMKYYYEIFVGTSGKCLHGVQGQ